MSCRESQDTGQILRATKTGGGPVGGYMAHVMLRAALLAGACLFVLPAFAQEQTPDLVITPNKQAQSIQEIGSAVTIITQKEIEREGPKSVRDILDGQPGITATENGGPGGTASLFLRGSNSNHVLVLIDGVRVNDPTTVGGDLDLSMVAPQSIERIEIVRGPQSALYGSDAIGGVINIITKKGQKGPPVWRLRMEGGSYGTFSSLLGVSGATQDTNYSIALSQYHTDGFQRYGYRVPRLAYLDPNGSDPFSRLGGYGKISKRINDWLTLEFGYNVTRERSQFDSGPFSDDPLVPNTQTGQLATAYQKAIAENGPFRTTLTTFETKIRRDIGLFMKSAAYGDTDARYKYKGTRLGAELQEDIKLNQYGTLTFGTRYESERAKGDEDSARYNYLQTTRSVYTLYQVSLFQKLHLSAGARYDDVSGIGGFGTYRLTAAYDLTATTRLRSSYGTGAKAPSLYQLYVPIYNNPLLKPETSKGFDFGVEQTFLDGDARASVTYFNSRIENLIVGDPSTYLPTNVARASISGFEIAGDYNIVPTFMKLKLAYTWLKTRDESTGLELLRRPRHSARISVAFTPTRELTIEPILRLIDDRADTFLGARVTLKAYARFDVAAEYKLNQTVSVFARAENLTNAKYEDVYNFGTAGRSGYAGLQMTW